MDEAHAPVERVRRDGPSHVGPGHPRPWLPIGAIVVIAGQVTVPAQEIQRLVDQRHVLVAEHRPQTGVRLALLDGVEPPVEVIVVELVGKGLLPSRFNIVLTLGLRQIQRAVRGDADLRRQDCLFPDYLSGFPVGQQQILREPQHLFCLRFAPGGDTLEGGVGAMEIAFPDKRGTLIEGHPIRHFIRQSFHHDGGKGGEILADRGGEPTALLMDPQRQIPVVERDQRRDARGEQLVHQRPVEVQPLLVDLALLRHHPGPADGEAIGIQADLLHQRHVLPEAVIVVAGDLAAVSMGDMSVREGVPDARPFAVFVVRALDLIGRAGRTPKKILRKAHDVSS